jgi:hypothetical protein
MGSGDKSTNEWADNRQTMAPGARLGSRGIFASSARRSVSEAEVSGLPPGVEGQPVAACDVEWVALALSDKTVSS